MARIGRSALPRSQARRRSSPTGTSTGGVFNVSKGATLDLTGGADVAYQGTYIGSGAGTVALKSGTLEVGASGATFNMSGKLLQWTGGAINVTNGSLTNTGTINYTGAGNAAIEGAGNLINHKSLLQTGAGTLMLENGATFDNAKGATYLIEANGGVGQLGGGTLVNAGTLKTTKRNGSVTISASTFDNTGTVATLGMLNISSVVAQISGGALTAGTWDVEGIPVSPATLEIGSTGGVVTIGAQARVLLSGPSNFTNLSGLDSIAKGGSFTLASGADFSTSGRLTNAGKLTIGPGSIFTVNGNHSQTSTGILAEQIGGSDSLPTFGQIVSTTGTVTLGGKLSVTSTVLPAVDSFFELVDNEGSAAIAGTFAGLAEGATFSVKRGTTIMTFQVSYEGGDGNDVVLKRIS